jgi:hypothetical protein
VSGMVRREVDMVSSTSKSVQSGRGDGAGGGADVNLTGTLGYVKRSTV